MKPYENKFNAGDHVRIKSRSELEAFRDSWKYHHPLEEAQLDHAGNIAEVSQLGFYHGGDVIYNLEGIPGVWHEVCLEAAMSGT